MRASLPAGSDQAWVIKGELVSNYEPKRSPAEKEDQDKDGKVGAERTPVSGRPITPRPSAEDYAQQVDKPKYE